MDDPKPTARKAFALAGRTTQFLQIACVAFVLSLDRFRLTLMALYMRIATRMSVLTCGVIVLAIGVTTLLGYLFGVDGLARWQTGVVAMAPNTATGFVFTGFALTVIATSNRFWRCS